MTHIKQTRHYNLKTCTLWENIKLDPIRWGVQTLLICLEMHLQTIPQLETGMMARNLTIVPNPTPSSRNTLVGYLDLHLSTWSN